MAVWASQKCKSEPKLELEKVSKVASVDEEGKITEKNKHPKLNSDTYKPANRSVNTQASPPKLIQGADLQNSIVFHLWLVPKVTDILYAI
jgi:hypothetical protein